MEPEEKTKVGYEAALQLVNYEGRLIWAAFTALLAANVALVTIGGAILKFFPRLIGASAFLGIVGLVICLV